MPLERWRQSMRPTSTPVRSERSDEIVLAHSSAHCTAGFAGQVTGTSEVDVSARLDDSACTTTSAVATSIADAIG